MKFSRHSHPTCATTHGHGSSGGFKILFIMIAKHAFLHNSCNICSIPFGKMTSQHDLGCGTMPPDFYSTCKKFH